MDENMKPYAEFLEEICKAVYENQPISCGFVCRTKDDTIGTIYYGKALESVFEKKNLAFAFEQDAIMGTVFANADMIKEKAEEIEAENADKQ